MTSPSWSANAHLLPNLRSHQGGLERWSYGFPVRSGQEHHWQAAREIKRDQVCIGCWSLIRKGFTKDGARAFVQVGTWLWRCLACGVGET